MARQFDVFRLADSTLVMVLQHDLADHLELRVVAPLVTPEQIGPVTRGLNPIVQIDGVTYRIKLEMLAAIRVGLLRDRVTACPHLHDEIVRGLDLLFTGV